MDEQVPSESLGVPFKRFTVILFPFTSSFLNISSWTFFNINFLPFDRQFSSISTRKPRTKERKYRENEETTNKGGPVVQLEDVGYDRSRGVL